MTDFEKMAEMSSKNKDIRMFPISSNVKRANTGKDGFGEIVLAVNNETIVDMMKKEFVGGLYVMDAKQWKELK